MGKKLLDRRRLLLGATGLGGALALLWHGRPASALSIERIPPQSGLGVAYANRCGTDALHAKIMAQLDKVLAERTGIPGTSISMTEYCPICGCPIIATRHID